MNLIKNLFDENFNTVFFRNAISFICCPSKWGFSHLLLYYLSEKLINSRQNYISLAPSVFRLLLSIYHFNILIKPRFALYMYCARQNVSSACTCVCVCVLPIYFSTQRCIWKLIVFIIGQFCVWTVWSHCGYFSVITFLSRSVLFEVEIALISYFISKSSYVLPWSHHIT